MSASSTFTSTKGHRRSSAAYGRLTVGMKPQRECHHRINRSIAIANQFDRRKAMSTNFRSLRNIRKRPAAVPAARLMRAYSGQVETLRRLRHGGDQHVRVEHIHINEGGTGG